MKKILSLILCLMLSCSLVGCGESSISNGIKIRSFGNVNFMVIDYGGEIGSEDCILVDINERTQYLFIDDGYHGGITLLVDSEGKPLLYEGEIPYGNQ